MTRLENKLARYRKSPKNVGFEEIKSLLEALGFEVENYSGGSHFSVSHPKYDVIGPLEPNTVPMKKPGVMEIYVRRAIKWIDVLIEKQKAEEAA